MRAPGRARVARAEGQFGTPSPLRGRFYHGVRRVGSILNGGERQRVIIVHQVHTRAEFATPPLAREAGAGRGAGEYEQFDISHEIEEARAAGGQISNTAASRDAATAAGEVITLQEIRTCQKLQAAFNLLKLFPPGACAAVLGTSQERVMGMVPAKVVSDCARALAKTGVSTLKGALSALLRALAWADDHDVAHGMVFDGVDTRDFLDHVQAQAELKVRERRAKFDAENAARAAKGLAPKTWPANARDASSARETVKTSLKWLTKHGVQFNVDAPAVVAGGFARRAPEPKEPLSIKDVVALEDGAVDGGNEFLSGHQAAFAKMAHASLRLEQANFCLLEFEDDGTVHGFVGKEKDPVPAKQKARPFWMASGGFRRRHGRKVLERLLEMLKGVECGCFLLRDTDSVDGDPRRATAWRNAPCTGQRALNSLRACVEATGRSAEWAARYGYSSCRPVLPEIACAREEPAPRRVEIGRWSGSTAKDKDLAPEQREQLRHARDLAVLPDRYARTAKVQRVCKIIHEQMSAVHTLLASGATLPDSAGWELMPERPVQLGELVPLEVLGGECDALS